MALSIGAIIGIIFGLAILGLVGYIVYRYTKDSKRTYTELKDSSNPPLSGACKGTSLDSKWSAGMKSADKCGYLCDETKTCAGYQWDSTCSLYSSIDGVDTTNKTANCYEPSMK